LLRWLLRDWQGRQLAPNGISRCRRNPRHATQA
jgi:hypothetical protein